MGGVDRLNLLGPFGILRSLCSVALFTVFRFRSSGEGGLLGSGRLSGPCTDAVNFLFVLYGNLGAFPAG